MVMQVDEPGSIAGRWIMAMVTTLVLGGCGVLGNEIKQEAPEDETSEIAVKRALIESESVGGAAIRVVVAEDGTVTLDGFVNSEAERVEALRAAREVLGGVEPVDALRVLE